MTTDDRIERLERFSCRVKQDMYGYGNPKGIGAMSRLKALEDQAEQQKLTRRWLVALMATTGLSVLRLIIDLLG